MFTGHTLIAAVAAVGYNFSVNFYSSH